MNKRSRGLFLVILVIVGLHTFLVQAEDRAYFSADKTILLVGEPIQLTLHIRVPQNAQLILPDFTTTLSPIMVENVGPLNLVQQFDDASVEYSVLVKGVFWQIGKFQIPPLKVSYQLADSTIINLTVDGLQFEVPSVLNDNDLSLRSFKPVVDLPYFPIWQILSFSVLVLGVAYLLFRRRLATLKKRTFQIENNGFSGHPDVVYALNALQQIEQSNDSPLVIYVEVSVCLRSYLSKRYSVQALDLTTSELMGKLSVDSIFAHEHQQKLAELLKRADLVKFARVVPQKEAAQQYSAVAAQWIQAVEQARLEQPV